MAEELNPVGVAKVELIAQDVQEIIALWQEKNPVPGWFTRIKGAWVKAVNFILRVTDYLILAVEEKIPDGADKKATVLAAVGLVYDAIVPPLLPVFLKPFNASIRSFVIDTLVSASVDWIVSKYREGSWRPKTTIASLL